MTMMRDPTSSLSVTIPSIDPLNVGVVVKSWAAGPHSWLGSAEEEKGGRLRNIVRIDTDNILNIRKACGSLGGFFVSTGILNSGEFNAEILCKTQVLN